MVRHYVDNRRPNLTVVVDTEIDSYPSERQFDTAIEVAASLGVSSMVNGQPVAIWLDGEVVMGKFRAADAQRPARPPHAGRGRRRHRCRRQRPACPAHRDRDVGARRGHRQRADGALPAHGQRRPALDPRHPRARVAGG